jgi:hypothetical protein
MKKFLNLLAIGIVLLLVLTGCQNENDEGLVTVPDYPSDVINWNMYSWQEGGEWVFSIVDHEAGYDTFDQISADEFKLPGLDYLVEALQHLPEHSQLVWTEHVITGTELPDTTLIYEILNYSNSIGVAVSVMN